MTVLSRMSPLEVQLPAPVPPSLRLDTKAHPSPKTKAMLFGRLNWPHHGKRTHDVCPPHHQAKLTIGCFYV